jgi:hypothetical protein
VILVFVVRGFLGVGMGSLKSDRLRSLFLVERALLSAPWWESQCTDSRAFCYECDIRIGKPIHTLIEGACRVW